MVPDGSRRWIRPCWEGRGGAWERRRPGPLNRHPAPRPHPGRPHPAPICRARDEPRWMGPGARPGPGPRRVLWALPTWCYTMSSGNFYTEGCFPRRLSTAQIEE